MGAPRAIAGRIADTLEPFLRPRYSDGNRIVLLASAQRYFPQLHAAIAGATRSIWLETYILADDTTGRTMIEALRAAAQRGVAVRVLVDGFGGGPWARQLVQRFPEFGAQLRIYRPERWWRGERRLFRRLHRKIAVIDERIAFVGGINVDDSPASDELTGEALGPRLDFAVECQGPIVADIALAVERLWWRTGLTTPLGAKEPLPRRAPVAVPFADGVRAAIILRDNLRHRRSIEHSYLAAVRAARQQIVIASAYFQPGQRFRRALIAAARRGVRVTLLLQGRVEYRLQHYAQRALYGQLLAAGMEIHEYQRSYLHAKVAVMDREWATVGSSNIDALSLLLAREANVVVRDGAFCDDLRGHLDAALRDDSRQLQAADYARRSLLTRAVDWIAYGVMRAATVVLAHKGEWRF